MSDIMIFKRYEKKYRISEEQKCALLALVGDRLTPDKHGRSTVCSLYLDTPDFLLIRNSIDALSYKEKLRARSYGAPSKDGRLFLEIKKKYRGVVYKRRVIITRDQLLDYLESGVPPFDSQIMREIDYLMKRYGNPRPAVCVICEREAYFAADDPNVRLTFDLGLRYRRRNFPTAETLCEGTPIIDANECILEIKTPGAMPLWLSRALTELKIYPSPFSKYAYAYYDIIKKKK